MALVITFVQGRVYILKFSSCCLDIDFCCMCTELVSHPLPPYVSWNLFIALLVSTTVHSCSLTLLLPPGLPLGRGVPPAPCGPLGHHHRQGRGSPNFIITVGRSLVTNMQIGTTPNVTYILYGNPSHHR